MSQAKDESTFSSVKSLTVAEAQALADRLFSRSQSALFVASPEVRRDLCMASRAIRSMLHEVHRMPRGAKTRRTSSAASKSTSGGADGAGY